jgi:hypothetical protein
MASWSGRRLSAGSALYATPKPVSWLRSWFKRVPYQATPGLTPKSSHFDVATQPAAALHFKISVVER